MSVKHPPIKQAMILAAGRGERMRPLTDACPKPLVPVNGKPIIDYALDSLEGTGVERVVVNTHYKAEMLHAHLAARRQGYDIVVSHEPALLDTGGGIKNALRHLDASAPLLVLSGDSILLGQHAMQGAWDDAAMDLLLLLIPLEKMVLTPGIGDYDIVNGKPVRTPGGHGKYMWTSARILHPRLFDAAPDGAFSFLQQMDAAEQSGRLAAAIHDGVWHHLTTPEDIARVEAAS